MKALQLSRLDRWKKPVSPRSPLERLYAKYPPQYLEVKAAPSERRLAKYVRWYGFDLRKELRELVTKLLVIKGRK